jgi:negative regulator of sigma-B (phosphoserine phosphatase)
MVAVTAPLVDWAAASQALAPPGGSGDQYVVAPRPNGVVLAAVDGLGHGADAELAAALAIDVLREHAHESIIPLVNRCHRRLASTRGVVLSVAVFNALEGTMTWLGVGNVDGVLLRRDPLASPRREFLLLRAGVVGVQLPTLQATIVPVAPGDTLIFATDGVRSDFAGHAHPGEPPQRTADRILSQFGKGTDDALVLVARYVGAAA